MRSNLYRGGFVAGALSLFMLAGCAGQHVDFGLVGKGYGPHVTVSNDHGDQAGVGVDFLGDNLFGATAYVSNDAIDVGGALTAIGSDGLVSAGAHAGVPAAKTSVGFTGGVLSKGLIDANANLGTPVGSLSVGTDVLTTRR